MNDVAFYDQRADSWWDPNGFLHGIGTLLNPVRLPYIERVLARHDTPAGAAVLDIGCGGGLLAEAIADLGFPVTGIDRSQASVAAGHDRARNVRYVVGDAGRLPFADDSFDVVTAMEVLEHVADPAAVVAEAGRILKPGGLFFFAGPNRTRLSRLVVIDLAQRWRWSAVLPEDLHEWHRFIAPAELTTLASAAGISIDEVTGVGPRLSVLSATGMALWRLRRGRIGHAEAGRRIRLKHGGSRAVAYMGYGRRR
ncbi:MAG: bifunctional 2-polyprenyl-6-hydroxyphenol methylase/3-demethylubiquinol 3-O-methyltransferase UbiG [Acidimicrobiia bacterium]